MTRSDDPERRLSEALRAQATGAPGVPGPVARIERSRSMSRADRRGAQAAVGFSTRAALLLALLGGAVLGVVLALLSLWAPGVLPALG